METMDTLFDPRDPSMRVDPYPYYRRLRETDPVHRSPFGYWVLSRYDDVDTLLRSPNVSSEFHRDPTWCRHRGGPDSPVVANSRRWMLTIDGPAHRRVRGVVNRVFSAAAVERMRPRIASLIAGVFDPLGEGDVDLIEHVALPLPVTVICELVGLPAADRRQCREWTEQI